MKLGLATTLAFVSLFSLGASAQENANGAMQPAETNGATGAIVPIPAAYIVGPTKIPERALNEWLENASALLGDYPDGGILMSNMVRALAGSDNRTVDALIALSNDSAATPAQRAAIGAGLARAAQGAQIAAPKYGAYIAVRVAQSASAETVASFKTALSEKSTAALGFSASNASRSAAPGSGTLTGGGSPARGSGVGAIGSNTTPQTTETFSVGRGYIGEDTNSSEVGVDGNSDQNVESPA